MPSFKHGRTFLLPALLHGLLVHQVAAAGCWQNTTCTGPLEPSFPGPWESNMYSPASRTVSPVRILDPSNRFLSAYPDHAHLNLNGNGSLLVFDFGQEVGG